MTIQAAIQLGVEIVIYSGKPGSPAGRWAVEEVVGEGWYDDAALKRFAEACDLITLENEFVPAPVLEHLVEWGTPVVPGSHTLGRIQDKFIQKETLHADGIPVARYMGVEQEEDVLTAAEAFGWPLVLKVRHGGYDGYGNATITGPEDLPEAWETLSTEYSGMLVEEWVPFDSELAVMVLRGHDDDVIAYPVVETVQKDHICHVVRAPAAISDDEAAEATDLAMRAVKAMDGVGVFGVELFRMPEGGILLNEMAPRPHNSGHYTIEGCVTSQFENHLRAILGWPLGKTGLRAPGVAMVNILGEREADADMDAIREGLGVPGAHVHLYGKYDVRMGRKMGHVTVLAETVELAEAAAHRAVGLINL
jgi:5-(carboxyamino)imidazole ribonucleotide synthase